MYISEDLERFYFLYQSVALSHGESHQSFCVKNNVPYNIFQKRYKDTRKNCIIYNNVVGTMKIHGYSIWNFIGTFFKKNL